jgi:hypothetical protein
VDWRLAGGHHFGRLIGIERPRPLAANHNIAMAVLGEPSQVHLHRYLEEFVFRWNRRRHMKSSFDMLLTIAAGLPHAGYRDFADMTV